MNNHWLYVGNNGWLSWPPRAKLQCHNTEHIALYEFWKDSNLLCDVTGGLSSTCRRDFDICYLKLQVSINFHFTIRITRHAAPFSRSLNPFIFTTPRGLELAGSGFANAGRDLQIVPSYRYIYAEHWIGSGHGGFRFILECTLVNDLAKNLYCVCLFDVTDKRACDDGQVCCYACHRLTCHPGSCVQDVINVTKRS